MRAQDRDTYHKQAIAEQLRYRKAKEDYNNALRAAVAWLDEHTDMTTREIAEALKMSKSLIKQREDGVALMVDTRQVLTEALVHTRLIHNGHGTAETSPDIDFDNVPGWLVGSIRAMRDNAEWMASYIIRYLAAQNVAMVEDDGEHYMNVRYDADDDRTDWTIQHPARCRPNLLACPMNDGVTRYFEELPHMRAQEGRFKLVDTNEGVGTEPA